MICRDYNKFTTPLRVVLFTYYSLQTYHYWARDGRVVLNIDGTGALLKWGIRLASQTYCQHWELSLTPSHMKKSLQDTNRVVSRNIDRVPLWHYHSPLTKTDDLAQALSMFFNGQPDLDLPKYLPLAFLSDCAPQIIAAIMKALAFPNEKPVTKVVYNNIMSIVFAYCEMEGYDEDVCRRAINFSLEIIPTFVKWCRAHVIRAVYHWVTSTQRPTVIRTYKSQYQRMLLTVARHVTASLSFIDSIIHLGLFVHITRSNFLSLAEETIENTNANVKAFMNKQRDRLTCVLKQLYDQLRDDKLRAINSSDYLPMELIDSVAKAAKAEKLRFSASYCEMDEDGNRRIMSNICYGFFPSLVDEDNDENMEVLDTKRKPRWVYSLPSSTQYSEINDSTTQFVCVRNPLFEEAASKYVLNQLGRNLALIHWALIKVCYKGRQAVVETSNNAIEGAFKDEKRDPDLRAAAKDPATFMWEMYQRSIDSSRILVKQMRKIDHVVESVN